MAEILTTQQALDCNKSDTPYISIARLVRSHEALRARVTELEKDLERSHNDTMGTRDGHEKLKRGGE